MYKQTVLDKQENDFYSTFTFISISIGVILLLYFFVFVGYDSAYTELYFTDIPQQIGYGDQIDLSFIIHNHEGLNKRYSYTVYVEEEGIKYILKTGSVFMLDDQKNIIQEKVTLPSNFSEGKVHVLIDSQEIYFHLQK